MNLDAYMDDFGRDLNRAAARKKRSRRRYVRLAPVIGVGAALAVAFTVLPSGGGGVDAIAAARAALAPNGEIVHMKVQIETGSRTFVAPESEQWYAADPLRWRMRTLAPDSKPGVAIPLTTRSARGMGRIETAFSNNRLRFYSEQRDVVTIQRNLDRRIPMTGPSMLGGDPSTDLREQLNKGGLRDDGVVTRDGRQVRRLVSETKLPGGKWTQQFVYYMDPQTFAPVGGRIYFIVKGREKKLRGIEFTVTQYERIPLNEQTEELLKIEKTPDTKYVWLD